jgi:Tol biopolymer transport system component
LAYIAAPGGAVEIVDLADGFHTTFATHLGEPASWAPDGETLVVGDSVPLGEMLLSHLFVADLRAGTLRELGAADPSDDGSAAWSPRGDWIAFGRRQIGGAAATLGRQLWLARPDGGEARALTAEPAANYSAFAWSPDAGRLLAVRFALGEPGARPAVWLFDVSAGEGRELVEGATQPGWVP